LSTDSGVKLRIYFAPKLKIRERRGAVESERSLGVDKAVYDKPTSDGQRLSIVLAAGEAASGIQGAKAGPGRHRESL
jgi:hypothetical protein